MKKIILFTITILLTTSPILAQDITSSRAIKEFFKEQTTLRIAEDSIEIYKTTLNHLSRKVIARAHELAKKDKRKTILQRDIQQAAEETFRQAPMTVSELIEKIQQLSIIALVNLNNKLKTYSEKLLEGNK